MLDQLAKQVLGGLSGSSGEGASQLVGGLAQLLGGGSQGGGLAGLVQAFQKNGLGDIVSSWISTGENLPISAEQIQTGLGTGLLQQFANTAGLSQESASSKLAELLPGVIDKLTPDGKLPASGLLEQALNSLKAKG
jgi:uncharacterized protein YidB (DUF937 family)